MSESLQRKAAELLGEVDRQQAQSKYKRLTVDEKTLMYRMAKLGTMSQAEIARAIGCDPATVCRHLQLMDTRPEARALLEAGAARLAETVVDTNDPAVALKALGKLDVVRDDREGGGGSNILIAIGQPGAPLEPPVLTIGPDGSVTVDAERVPGA